MEHFFILLLRVVQGLHVLNVTEIFKCADIFFSNIYTNNLQLPPQVL